MIESKKIVEGYFEVFRFQKTAINFSKFQRGKGRLIEVELGHLHGRPPSDPKPRGFRG